MGDPTGIAGAIVAKLLDQVISETKKTIYCRRYCENLKDLLQNIQPLVTAAARQPSARSHIGTNETVTAGGPQAHAPVEKWLKDLEGVLGKAQSLVLKCNSPSLNAGSLRLNPISKNKMSRKILDITEQIRQIIDYQAPLALLATMEETFQAVTAHNQVLVDTITKLRQDLNIRDVGDTTQQILQIEGIHPTQAFQEIKSRTDILAAGVHRGGQQERSSFGSSQEAVHEELDDMSSDILRLVPDLEFIFGMDAPLARLQGLLLGGRTKSRWLGIWGKGGIGKTLLVERATNSKDVQDHFKKNIFWLTVGRNPSIRTLQMQLGERLRPRIQITNLDSVEDGKRKLSKALSGQKVLLVLDDVWEDDGVLDMLDVTSDWDIGSKTLVTTRNDQVLKRKIPDLRLLEESTVRMDRLSDEDSWALFCQHTFGGVNNIPSPLLHDLVRAVTDECKGLPLALKVIAGALAGQNSIEQWQRALNKLKEAEMLDETHEIQLYNRLQLSYDALAPLDDFNDVAHRGCLQKCFIYFAGFPEDSDVDVEKLVELLAGEKLLDTNEDNDYDPSPDGYYVLGLLIGRSLIDLQKATWSDKVNSPRMKCRIHDVLRDLALHLVRKRATRMDCLFKAGRGLRKFPDEWLTPARPGILDRLGPSPSSLNGNATHLSLSGNCLEELPAKLRAPSLEVILLDCQKLQKKSLVIPPGFLESFSNLKVLDLARTTIESLPETVENLTNLIYLNLSYTTLRTLPRGLRKLRKLESLSLQNCGDLEPWPFDISSLKSLMSLNTRGCGGIWKPKSGSRGMRYITGNNLESLASLCSLTLLTHLSISDNSGCKQLPSEMSSLVNLRHLGIFFPDLLSLPPQLQIVNEPRLSKLQYLTLDNCRALSELPSWMGSLPKLTNCMLSFCASLRSLPDLHLLQGLRKLDISFCTKLIQLPAGFASKEAFPALTELFMMNCIGLREFPPIEDGAFPLLTDLVLTGCEFEKLPSSLRLLPNLVKLSLNLCRRLQSLDDCFWLETGSRSRPTSSARSNDPTSVDHVRFFRSLQKLGLRQVPLKTLPPSLAACPVLNEIDLTGKQVLTVPESLRLLQDEGKLIILASRPS